MQLDPLSLTDGNVPISGLGYMSGRPLILMLRTGASIKAINSYKTMAIYLKVHNIVRVRYA